MSEQPSGPPTGPPTGPTGLPPRGPMFMRDEYQNLIDEFTKDVKADLKNEVDCLLLVGSVVTKEHIAGESDCDFVMILKDKAAGDNLEKTMEKISEVVAHYLEDPLYSSLLDVEVLTSEEIPTDGVETDYPWTRVLVAQMGKTLIGKNPFEKVKLKEEDIKKSAKQMAEMFLEQMVEIPKLSEEEADEYDKLYLTVDAVLGCGCAYLYYHGEKEFYRSSAIILFEDKYKDKINIEPIQISHRLRLAAKTVNTDKFTEKSLKFCKEVVKQLT